MRRARHVAPLSPPDWAAKFYHEDDSPDILDRIERAGKADLVVLVKYLLYEWSLMGSRWVPGMTEAVHHAHDLREAARYAVKKARERRSDARAEMFRKRELDALHRFAGVADFHPREGEPLEAALKRALRRDAPSPRPMRRDFFLVVLYEAAASRSARLTWFEVATLAQIASRAAGRKSRPDERELRRYAAQPGVRDLARQWVATFPPVVESFNRILKLGF